ncbi:hypothetical protein KL86DYS2_12580 [uncultured Dysgonomonas sp.]|uniref:Uncharacterized protein n=1 Tax=uncultured Dysgonomonas sp. TaxID=206096 RepID=A0A212JY00_9BACT|nr:hypothetical protein KL86DYS2_12580 [uncultured Dysgonomonas sp.]
MLKTDNIYHKSIMSKLGMKSP